MNKEGARSEMRSGLLTTFSYIYYFKFGMGTPNQYLLGVSPEGIGFIFMYLALEGRCRRGTADERTSTGRSGFAGRHPGTRNAQHSRNCRCEHEARPGGVGPPIVDTSVNKSYEQYTRRPQ